MSTVKVLRKVAAQIQAGATYEAGAMYLLPLLGGILNQNFNQIDDNSINGEAFMDIPQQGTRMVGGDGLSFQVDKISIETILEAAFGTNAFQVFSLGSNTKKLSICTLDSVNANQYANAYIKRLALSSSVNSVWQADMDFVHETAESRVATSNFPAAPTAYEEPFTFHEAGGTNGYIRIGDAVDALDSGDNVCFEDLNLELNNGFDNQFTNCGLGTLTPLFGMAVPACTGSFTVARHDTDNYLDWQDAHTPLQMEILIYKSATAQLKIEIPRFVIKATPTDDDITKIDVEMLIGRNGTGTSYKNTNMAFTSPIRITLTNA